MERRLAAILAVDMVSYGRLMATDEAGTLARQKRHKIELIDPRIAEYGGRVFKTTGDGLLAEFPSVVDAVRCAVMIQLAMQEQEVASPELNRITYRIGVNLGDIVAEDGDIYGNGVIVAARLEALAEPGGICVSRTVVDHVRGRVASDFEGLGAQSVKNIPEPIHVFRVRMMPEMARETMISARKDRLWKSPVIAVPVVGLVLMIAAVAIIAWQNWSSELEPASVTRMAFPLPDKPSIAVLPFFNLSADPEQEYFADGITNDLITDLSKFKNLFVIAANSTFIYKGKPVKAQTVAEDLGVRYVLEGSVQRIGNILRINAQLIDAVNGHHLWAERYDHDIEDLFALQNEVVDQVVSALSVELAAGEQHSPIPTDLLSPESYQLFLHARKTLPAYFADNDDLREARQLFERVIERAPDFSGGYAGLSLAYALAVMRGYTRSPDEDGNKALELAQKALKLDPEYELALRAMANALQAVGQTEDAIAILNKLVRASPSNADAHARLGLLLIWAGRAKEATEPLKTAIRLNPYVGSPYLGLLGLVSFTLGQYDAAIAEYEKNSSRGGPIDDAGLAVWTASYYEAGRSAEAATIMARLINRYPGFHLRSFWLSHNFAQAEDREHLIEILRRASIPMDRPFTR
jgi:adenylate cyclase